MGAVRRLFVLAGCLLATLSCAPVPRKPVEAACPHLCCSTGSNTAVTMRAFEQPLPPGTTATRCSPDSIRTRRRPRRRPLLSGQFQLRLFPGHPGVREHATWCTGRRSATSSSGRRSSTSTAWAFRAACSRRPSRSTTARSTWSTRPWTAAAISSSTATDPAGPWSDPIWLPDDRRHRPVAVLRRRRQGLPAQQRAARGQAALRRPSRDLDAGTSTSPRRKPVGPRKVLIDGGVDLSKNPIWIEGPHLYKRDGWYYLVCAEGGTRSKHSQVILRSRSLWGPYAARIARQSDSDPARSAADRADPIINAGHADLVEGAGRQLVGDVPRQPRLWRRALQHRSRNLPAAGAMEGRLADDPCSRPRSSRKSARGPAFMRARRTQAPLSGNFTWRDEFDSAGARTRVAARARAEDRVGRPALAARHLAIHPLAEGLDTLRNPSFLARRQQHLALRCQHRAARCRQRPASTAGLAAFQNETHWFFLGVRTLRRPCRGVPRAARRQGSEDRCATHRSGGEGDNRCASAGMAPTIVSTTTPTAAAGGGSPEHDDGTMLSTDVAGGFVGAMLGPYARIAHPR